MGKYSPDKGEVGKFVPNLLNRDFSQLLQPRNGIRTLRSSPCSVKSTFSPILALHSSDLVSFVIPDCSILFMVAQMVEAVFFQLPPGAVPILHSDHGWQYQHKQYQKMLSDHGVVQSMSRKGNCLDNALIENFFGLLKSEWLGSVPNSV
ncbi:MAG: transposase family protein [Clostridia bacterium]|nr:transposase family protein [Clostridia bacterium]